MKEYGNIERQVQAEINIRYIYIYYTLLVSSHALHVYE